MDSLRAAVVGGLFGREESTAACGCEASFEDGVLRVDATGCPEGGRLGHSEDCRATVVERLTQRDADAIEVRNTGLERVYEGRAAALLVAAGRFREAARVHDDRLAERVTRDPLGVAHEAAGRAGAVADIAAETGLAESAESADGAGDEGVLAPRTGLTVSDWQVDAGTPSGGRLIERRELETGSTVRIYAVPEGRDQYVLGPAGQELESAGLEMLAAAYERLSDGRVTGGKRAAGRAVRAVAEENDGEEVSVERVAGVLHKHTRGHGLLADLFADPDVSDVFVTAPAPETPLSVRAGDRRLRTNVRLTDRGAESLASRYRRESGRGFSRAEPTLDAATEIRGRRVRVAGVTEPASDGVAFAFRAHDGAAWTLPALIGNGTLTAEAAALCSLAVERGSAVLVAGPRGAGKTTLLGALLWELPPSVRTVVIEDTPELPVTALQGQGRDVQALRAAEEDGFSPSEALRTALRLGEGALAVGEVRGEEAQVLYEAMRVGANDDAVLGTIHGDGGSDVFERVVSDLGVPASSFGATDLLVTTERTGTGQRRVRCIEELLDGETARFEPLYSRPGGDLVPSGRIERGNSRLVEGIRHPGETYADLRSALDARTGRLRDLVRRAATDPDAVDRDALARRS